MIDVVVGFFGGRFSVLSFYLWSILGHCLSFSVLRFCNPYPDCGFLNLLTSLFWPISPSPFTEMEVNRFIGIAYCRKNVSVIVSAQSSGSFF